MQRIEKRGKKAWMERENIGLSGRRGGDEVPDTGERVNRYKGLIWVYLIASSGWK